MHDYLHSLIPLAVLLMAGIVSTTLLPRLGAPAILGYFLGGVIVGPSATGLVEMNETVALLAEFGVIFLLFDIGLHFSLKELWGSRRDFLGLGPLQWGTTAAAIGGALWYLEYPPLIAVVVAGSLALSSTAVALQTLQDRGERGTPLARKATALLIFQDVVAIVLLAVVGSQFGGDHAAETGLWASLGKAALAIAAVAVIGRMLRPAFAWITSSGLDEAFTAAALLVVVATAGITGMAGLSLPLGAFLGGMLLSESEYCYMIKTELKPFRGLLLGLFFITVGMSLDLSVVAQALWTTLALTLALIALKGLLVVFSARLSGAPGGLSIRMGFVMAQGSEFAFVIFGLLLAAGALTQSTGSILTAAVVLSMAATPALAPLGDRLGSALEARRLDSDSEAAKADKIHHVLISGAGDPELAVASALTAAGHGYRVLDIDRPAVVRARAKGFLAGYGNLMDPRLVESMDESANVLILGRTTPEESAEVIRRLRKRRPGLAIITRVSDESQAAPLQELGAVVCVAPEDPDDKTLAAETLRYLGVDEDHIKRWSGQMEQESEWEIADKAHANV
ncbi:MAG TPA: cation:proton antiporter [Acidobacteriota bacterium]|nr:cation:proton antiporter [Acidobacteriota bacterium]